MSSDVEKELLPTSNAVNDESASFHGTEFDKDSNGSPGAKTPKSPLLRVISFPIVYIQSKFYPGSSKGSVFTAMASALGTGILTLPYAVNLTGLYLGIFNIVLGFLLAVYSTILIVICADKSGDLTYEGIGQVAYGRWMRIFAEVNMMINNFGFVIAYIVLLKELIPHAFAIVGVENAFVQSQYFWACVVAIWMLLLSIPQQISFLRYTSVMSFLTILYLTIVVVIEFFVRKSDYGEAVAHAPPARINVFSIFLVVPLVLFAYTCHPNVLPIYVELKRQTVKRMNWILFIALFLVMAFYLLVGVFGFLTFYSKYSVSDFPGEILIAYKDGGVLTTVCSWTILLTVLTASPLLVHPCRDFTIVFFWKTRTIPKLKYLGVVTGICLLALVLSISIPSITIIFTLVGSVSSPFICYIIPCMYYLRLFPAKWYSPWTLVCWIVLISQIIFGVGSTVLFFIQLGS